MDYTNTFLQEAFGPVFEAIGLGPYAATALCLHLLLATTVLAVAAVIRQKGVALWSFTRAHAAPLCAVVAFGALLHAVVAEHYLQYFVDEPWAIEQAKIFVTGETFSFSPYQHNFGWPYLLSLAFRVLPISPATALALAEVCGLLSLALVYVFAHQLFGNRRVAVYAGLLVAVMPVHVFHSSCAAEHGPGLMLLLAGLIATIHCLREPQSFAVQLLTICVCTWMVLTRLETAAFLPIVLVLLLWKQVRLWSPGHRVALLAGFLWCALLTFPALYLCFHFFLSDELAQAEGHDSAFTFGHLVENLRGFGWYTLNHKRSQPWVVSALGLAGIVLALLRRRASGLVLLGWCGTGSLIYFSYFEFQEKSVLGIYTALSVAAAYLLGRLHSRWSGKAVWVGDGLMLVLLAATHSGLPDYSRSSINPNRAFYTELPGRLVEAFPEATTFVFHEPILLRMTMSHEVLTPAEVLALPSLSGRSCVFVSMFREGSAESVEHERPSDLRARYQLGEPRTLAWDYRIWGGRLTSQMSLSEDLRWSDLERDPATGQLERIRVELRCWPLSAR